MSSIPANSGTAGPTDRVRPSSWVTTSVSRSVWLSAASPSVRTAAGSSAAAIISSSRMDSAVSGVRS